MEEIETERLICPECQGQRMVSGADPLPRIRFCFLKPDSVNHGPLFQACQEQPSGLGASFRGQGVSCQAEPLSKTAQPIHLESASHILDLLPPSPEPFPGRQGKEDSHFQMRKW